jgi:hypothetical protein
MIIEIEPVQVEVHPYTTKKGDKVLQDVLVGRDIKGVGKFYCPQAVVLNIPPDFVKEAHELVKKPRIKISVKQFRIFNEAVLRCEGEVIP